MERAAMRQLVDHHIGLTDRYQRLLGDRLTRPEQRTIRRDLNRLTPPTVRARTRALRVDIRHLRVRLEHRYGGAPAVAIPPVLKSIAQCESHGDPRAVSGVGGTGDPAAASETEQDRRAAVLYRTGGPSHWPVCGR
jgi:hypothetical protein